MVAKNVSIRLDEEIIKNLRGSGSIEKLSTKIQHILQIYTSMEFTRESHWIPHPIDTYRVFFENMDENLIETYTTIMVKEYEKYASYSNRKFSDIECLINFGNLVSGPGGLVKKISNDGVDNIEYFTEHNLGLNSSKIIYSFYLKIAKLANFLLYDDVLETSFVSFKLKKNNS